MHGIVHPIFVKKLVAGPNNADGYNNVTVLDEVLLGAIAYVAAVVVALPATSLFASTCDARA